MKSVLFLLKGGAQQPASGIFKLVKARDKTPEREFLGGKRENVKERHNIGVSGASGILHYPIKKKKNLDCG